MAPWNRTMTALADSAKRCTGRSLQLLVLAGLLLNCVAARGQTATAPTVSATPTIQPARLFSYPAIRLDLVEPAPDGHHVIAQMDVPAINVWSLGTFYWPEAALVAGTVASLIILRRVLRRKQVIGQFHCRKCNYQLTALAALQCPECGTAISKRTRMKGRRRGWRLALLVIVVLSYATLYLTGLLETLRTGDFSHSTHWCWAWVYEWAFAQGNQRVLRHQDVLSRIVEIDPATGKVTRVIHEQGGQETSGMYVLSRDGSLLVWGPTGIWRYECSTGRTRMHSNLLGTRWLPHWADRLVACWLDPGEHVAFLATSRGFVLEVDLDSESIKLQTEIPREAAPRHWRPLTPFVSQRPFMAQLQSEQSLSFWMLGSSAPQSADLVNSGDLVWADVCLSNDGTAAYVLNNDQTAVEIWSLRTGTLENRTNLPLAQGLRPAISRNDQLLFVRSQSWTDVQVFDLNSNQWTAILKSPGRVLYGCVMADGKTVLMTGGNRGAPTQDLAVYQLP